jgi:uncharacterized protein
LRVVETLPRAVREIEHCWIPLADGTRLAARLWLPEGAEARPVPAVLEYIPYGKRDGTRERDEPIHRYFAGHGYASVRVDLRGSGESEGLLLDEYLAQEEDDGVAAIAWIAAQPWCDGSVGMLGKSWGGFNALQIAARRPPALRGVITVCSSDDRYADDAHYMGGCLLVENFRWGGAMFHLVAHPPDPELAGPGWRAQWLERLGAAEPLAARWLREPLRSDYWKHGSVCEDYARIACPVYAVGGWADAYTNTVPRLLAHLPGPRQGLVGPWAHLYPHVALPGPAIGFLQEALRFWEACLRPGGNGVIPGDPHYRMWMGESAPPEAVVRESPGRWVAEESWPSKRIEHRRLRLGRDGLGAEGPELPRSVRSPQTVGLCAGTWCSFGYDLPVDQRADDAGSLCFESAPLAERLEILGAPIVHLALAVDQPVAFVAVRLVDVFPDGTAARVTYGVQNLTHDADHAAWRPVPPGERRAVDVALSDVAHAFPAGHRLRVAISTTYWPLVWPSPASASLTVWTGASWLDLPVRPPRAEDAALRAFGPAEGALGMRARPLGPAGFRRSEVRDVTTGEIVRESRLDLDDAGQPVCVALDPIALELGHGSLERMRIRPDDALSAEVEIEHVSALRRDDWQVQVRTRTRTTATREEFRVEAELEAREAGRPVLVRRWDERVPRRGQ